MQHSTSSILSVCEDIFNHESCHQMARKCGFIQRSSSRISGPEFLKVLILPSAGLSEDSLHGLCARMREFNPEVNISASALAQRINTKSAIKFTLASFEKVLSITREKMIKQHASIENVLKHFKNIYIQDSTVFEVNKKLARFFPGTKRGGKKGATSCKSQIKIDLVHNLATGQIAKAEIYEGKRPDQALSGTIESMVKAGDLTIRDLGYFNIQSFSNIDKIGGYFLSRFPSHLKVYLNEKDAEPVNLATYLNRNYAGLAAIDLTVWISETRLKVRLIAYRAPKEVVIERRRKARKSAKEKGRTLSQEKLSLMDFSLFVTNIPESIISVEVIGTIYRLRWEIELIFKQCKSDLKIDVLRGVSLQRILCFMWSRLCMVILVMHITACFANLAKQLCGVELSSVKLVRYLQRNGILCKAMRDQKLKDLENNIIGEIPRSLKKDKRSRTTMFQRANNFEWYYEISA